MKIWERKYYLILGLIVFLGAVLRLLYLEQIPATLYSDEVSQAYNAKSLLETGKDEYGTSWPVSIRSFGDWKPPLQTYLLIPSIAVFGLHNTSVRLPSAILGTLSISLLSLLIRELLRKYFPEKGAHVANAISLIFALLLALSPWHIQQSRSAMLINIAFSCYFFALLFFIKGIKKSGYWVLSALFFVLTLYAYYGMRLIVPLTLIFLSLMYRSVLFTAEKYKILLISVTVGFVLLLPLLITAVSMPDVLFGRAKTVSVFYDKAIMLTQSKDLDSDVHTLPSPVASLLHNTVYLYSVNITKRFFEHLTFNFLFLRGDHTPPFLIPNHGLLYFVELFFLLIGVFHLLRARSPLLKGMLALLIISIIPSSLTFITPAANRSYNMLFPLLCMIAIGIYTLVSSVPTLWRYVVISLIFTVYLVQLSYFGYVYAYTLNHDYAQNGHYGYKQLYEYLRSQDTKYDEVVISAKISVPYIFLLYYDKISPQNAQTKLLRNFKVDEFGFEHVERYEKYRFVRNYSWEKTGERLSNALLVVTPTEVVDSSARLINTIYYPNEQSAFQIYEVRRNIE